MTDPVAEVRAARGAVARLYLDLNRLASPSAHDRLQRLGCLSLALDERVAALEAVPGDDQGQRQRLASTPIPVRFTAATGDPPTVEVLTVAQILAAARRIERELRPASGGWAERLRAELAKLEALGAAAERAGLGHGRDPLDELDEGVRAVLDRLDRPQAGDDLAAAAERVARRRRSLRQSHHTELNARLEAYRQKAADEGKSERPQLDAIYRDARRAMRAEGFDLARAGEAVLAYQRAVNAS